MSLSEGTRLGAYEILTLIGAGGMGEVYRARDTKLGRDVAIKVLPEIFSQDKERLARFEREARLLASLNHPNIATLFDLQESDGTHFLVLEFVNGETFAEQIRRGAISLNQALPIFKQIAEALEVAGKPRLIFEEDYEMGGPGFWVNYDVSPNGESFLMIKRTTEPPRKIHVVLNWFEELKRLAPRN
jgi:serine/threonine protein kinase